MFFCVFFTKTHFSLVFSFYDHSAFNELARKLLLWWRHGCYKAIPPPGGGPLLAAPR